MIYHVLQTVMPRWGYMRRLANDVIPLKIVEADSLNDAIYTPTRSKKLQKQIH